MTDIKRNVAKIDLRRVFCVADRSARAKQALKLAASRYDFAKSADDADAILALGGDGFMLDVLHGYLDKRLPIYGMNCGTVGFLMNSYRINKLDEAIRLSEPVTLFPLKMRATNGKGETREALAVNEVSLLRETRQAANLRVSVDGCVRVPELVGDGALVCTPAGSTAYNFSANGPIIPLGSGMLGLTPLNPFRPRRWSGALLSDKARIDVEVIDPAKRPVSAVADFTEVRDVTRVRVFSDSSSPFTLLFDKGHSLEERILNEQFLN